MENKLRKAWIAGLLSVVTIGLGHMYAGKARKGALLYLGQLLLFVSAMGVLAFKLNRALLIVSVASGLLYFLFTLIDAIRTAKKGSESYALKKYNTWYVYLAFWFLTGFIIQPTVGTLLKENLIKAYKIPAGSMLPTLFIGDRILVNRLVYAKGKPERGDIAVFEYPVDPTKDFVKRVVGVEGDVIEVRDKQLYVNGVEQSEGYVIHGDQRMLEEGFSQRDNFGPVTVPPDALFFMGDNRDNSHDSRFWGVVSLDKVRGKVMHIYWSWNGKDNEVRWDRIGCSL